MIRKLKLRYFVTNMAILSCTLLVGLNVLFGLLYHSEVESSYTVMQEMLEGASSDPVHQQIPPDGSRHTDQNPPPDAPVPGENAPDVGTNLPTAMTDAAFAEPMMYTYVLATSTVTTSTEAVSQADDESFENNSNSIACFDDDDNDDDCFWSYNWYSFYAPPDTNPPPYWGFMDPYSQWHSRHDRDDEESESSYNSRGNAPDERKQFEENNPPEPQHDTSSPAVTATTAATTTRATDGGSRPADPPRDDPPPPPPESSAQSSSTTVSASAQTSSATTVTTTTATAQVTAALTTSSGSTATETETSTTTALVPVEEGAYIPDALVAQIGDDGSIQSYVGNDSESNDEDRIRKVNNAMNEVKDRGLDSGTIMIDDTSYRYLYQTDAAGTAHLVLLNRTLEISTLSRLLVLFFFITILGLAGMFFLSMMLANWTVTPIATAWEKQKQFVADASHELKTPLAVISANTEVVRANPQESVAGSSKWLNYIQSETMRMSKLITNLLSVARMDQSSGSKAVVEPISLSDLVSNTCMVFDPIVFEHGKTLNSVIQKNVFISAEEDNVKQLLSILLDNAVLHSVADAQITVSLSKDAQGKIRLAVANTAKDIPKEQLDHLFDRFYRVDTEGSPNGSGLGLSIAKSIVHQMGGILTVTSENQLVTFLAVLS